jgi:anti-sigma B factor antagonist
MSAPEPPAFRAATRADEVGIWIDTSGEIDALTSPIWEKAMNDALAARPDRIYVDMHLVSFIDSSGLAALMRCHGLADKQHCKLIIRSPARQVDRVLALAGVKQRLTIEG